MKTQTCSLPPYRFEDRRQAGRVLAESLAGFARRIDTLILALPRGGVPVAYEVAKALRVPMDIWLVRKLGVPGYEELALGALASGDVCLFNQEIVDGLNIGTDVINAVIAREKAELERRNTLYRGGIAPPDVSGKTVIIIDDGLATGVTMRAAVMSLRQAGAAWVVAAVPVGAESACQVLAEDADEVVCVCRPTQLSGVGEWYEKFGQTSDAEVQSYYNKVE